MPDKTERAGVKLHTLQPGETEATEGGMGLFCVGRVAQGHLS